MPDKTALTGSAAKDIGPNPDDVIFASVRRPMVERPVYRGRRVKALSARCAGLVRYSSIIRLVIGLFCVFAFGLIGVAVADAFFCPEGAALAFWEGCLWETVGFGGGGGLLGFAFFLLSVQTFAHRPPP